MKQHGGVPGSNHLLLRRWSEQKLVAERQTCHVAANALRLKLHVVPCLLELIMILIRCEENVVFRRCVEACDSDDGRIEPNTAETVGRLSELVHVKKNEPFQGYLGNDLLLSSPSAVSSSYT